MTEVPYELAIGGALPSSPGRPGSVAVGTDKSGSACPAPLWAHCDLWAGC